MNWLQALLGIGKKPKQPAQNGYALCVGLNAVDPDFYEGWDGKLNACENDATAMHHWLQSKGYIAQKLLTKDATRYTVLTILNGLSKVAKAGDTVVFTNSSHGGQVPDYDSTETDGMDETICMFDGQIIDDELESAWAKFEPGVRIVFVSDSCHSGTVARAMFSDHESVLSHTEGSRAMPLVIQTQVSQNQDLKLRNIKAFARTHEDIRASVLALGACQDNQTAMDGPVNGAFTGALLSTLRKDPTASLGRIVSQCRRTLPPTQTPSYTYAGPRSKLFETIAAFSL